MLPWATPMRTAAAILLAAAPLIAQDRPDPAEQLRAKLASPFLKKAAWLTDFDVALRRARAGQQLIFGYFTTAGY